MRKKVDTTTTANDVAVIRGWFPNYATRILAEVVDENALRLHDALNRIAQLEETVKSLTESKGGGRTYYELYSACQNEEEIKEMAMRDLRAAVFYVDNPDRIRAIIDAMNKAIADKAESEGV